jgi:phosphate transport system protein
VASQFETELAALKEKLLIMASHAEGAVHRALKALIRRDDELARRTKEEDAIIDRLEIEIDEAAIRLLEQQPPSFELRLITVAMKISHNLERVGDEATTISRRCLELSREPRLPQQPDLPRMAGLALELLKGSLDAFVHRAPAKARPLILHDEEVDALNRQLQQELTRCMAQNPDSITRCLNLMVISKSIERIADHAKNIAEEAVYLYEGRDIRHMAKQPSEGAIE